MNLYKVDTNELYHHGVIGMKWGIRRYQNYDGSYTQKGLQRYRESEKKYDSAKATYKQAKQNKKQNPEAYQTAKSELKTAKKRMEFDYKQVKKDKRADVGKKLYQGGKTITGNSEKLRVAGVIATGTGVVASLLQQNGRSDLAKYAIYAGVGLEAVNGLMAVNNGIQANYLRSYYSHDRPKNPYD